MAYVYEFFNHTKLLTYEMEVFGFFVCELRNRRINLEKGFSEKGGPERNQQMSK